MTSIAAKTTHLSPSEARNDRSKRTSAEAKTRESLKAEFDRDPKIREEFGSFEVYSAYARAEAAGKIRVLRGPGK